MARSGLRLKAELIAKPVLAPLGPLSLATVWVDSGVFHLDSGYSYLIPGNLNEAAAIGSFVTVSFNGREIPAVVIGREELDSRSNLKSISSVDGIVPLLSPDQINLVRILAKKYCAHPFDIIRSMVPSRVLSVEKNRTNESSIDVVKGWKSKGNQYLQLPPHKERDILIAKKLIEFSENGSTVAIFPDVREVEAISNALSSMNISFIRYDSNQSRGEHYSSYLDIMLKRFRLVIGTRSAVFAPLPDLRNLVLYNEGSEHFYEKRSPGWCARDVAIERSLLESIDLTFIGYCPSLEIAHMIGEGRIVHRRVSVRPRVHEFSQTFGELIPSRALTLLKKSLSKGPLLFVTPSKGWAHAIRCSRCKTLSKCGCGGSLELKSERSPISCNHCGIVNSSWKCTWCESNTFSLVSRGMERHAHEIGKLFPGKIIRSSNADSLIEEEISDGIVIATSGMAPSALHGYSAVIFLEGNRLLNQADMRAQERVRELYFSHGALVREGGDIVLIQDEGNSISTALRMWNAFPVLESELDERSTLGLPPFVHALELTLPKDEITRLKSAIVKASQEGRLPREMKILGPILKGERSSIVLTTEIANANEVNLLIHEFMRRRSATKKALPSLRINPYSLSR